MDNINSIHMTQTYESIFEIIEFGTRPHMRTTSRDRGVLFLCVTSGKLRANGKGYEKNLSQGDCLAFALGRGYKLMRDGDESCTAAFVIADGAIVYNLMSYYGISDFASAKSPEALEALNDIQTRVSKPEGDTDGAGDALSAFQRFLFKFKRASQLGGRMTGGTAGAIKNYIDSHLEGRLSLEELSKIFFVSKTQIFRIFKDAYGIAPMQYFLSQKIELSKKLLLDGGVKVSDIAEMLSFTDAKHFSKTFKRYTGELPRNYKRRASHGVRTNDAEEE